MHSVLDFTVTGKSPSTKGLLVVQTYNNPMELGLDTWGHVGEVQIAAVWMLDYY